MLQLTARRAWRIEAGALLGITWLCGWLGVAGFVAASPAVPRDFYDIWQVEDWQQGAVTAIVQSRDGYLWLASYHGLARFDGVRLAVFDAGNAPGLRNGLITSLYEDPLGVLWIGHETGEATRFARGRFEPVPLAADWPGSPIEAIASDEAGDVWLLSEAGWLVRPRDGQRLRTPGSASATRKPALARAASGGLWVITYGVVSSLEQGRLAPVVFAGGQTDDFYERVTPALESGLWVLGNGRLRKWREGRWSEQLDAPLPPSGAITTLLETRRGQLLAGTLRDGLFLFEPGVEPMHFGTTNGLSSDWVRSLCEDHEGNIWIGTGAGLEELRLRKVKMLQPPDDFRGCAVLSFHVRPNGSAWIGTEGAGLYQYDGGRWSAFAENNGVSNLFVWSVLETRRGQLLAGTFGGGLLVRQEERFECPAELSGITAPILSLYEGSGGELWIGTRIGLHRYESGRLVWFAGEEQLAKPDVRAITQSRDGTLWFGMSGGGLGCLREGLLKQHRKRDGLGSDFVICLLADADGTLWIGSSDNGLTRFRDGRFATLSVREGLPNRILSQMVDDGAGNLWFGSQRGIFRASKADLHRCADGLSATVPCLSYGKAEGMATPSCSGGFQPGACRAADGRLWFPTSKGLAIVDPANVATNAVPPPVVIEELLVDNAPVALPPGVGVGTGAGTAGSPGDPVRIPPGGQSFEFHYTGLSFTAPARVRFRYRLEGLEPQWTEAGTKRFAQYSYLRPGDYTFRVIACNNDEVWNDAGASLTFTVLPHFWQTWWFHALCLAAGAAAVSGGVVWVTRRRVRRKLGLLERQRTLERERARIARDIHDDLGASLTRITMLSQSARGELEGHPQAAADLDQIYATARELTRAMDEIVWAVNPQHDSLDSLVTYLGRFAQHFLSAASIRCRLDVPLNLPACSLTSEVRHHVFLAFKEALHNVIKHARATEVRVSLELEPGGFALMIVDNGCGFDFRARQIPGLGEARLASGNGLGNMRRRLDEIGGCCQWDTAPGEGTRVRLRVRTAP